MNSRFLEERKKPILYMLEAFWTSQMKLFYTRGEFRQKDEIWSRHAISHIADRSEVGRQMICIPQKPGRALIRLLDNAAVGWVVDLDARRCTCLEWQDLRLPCAHAYCAASFFKVPPILDTHHSYMYTSYMYKQMYLGSCRTTLIDELLPDNITKPPTLSEDKKVPQTHSTLSH